ncbi:MAG: SCP2 sterol-binding domain-containing protein [Lachnospiraceae bacterium]|nr:SCP2 sterol-binding domain-containing protein [Lachnospiraceae bacterium]
MTYDELVLKVRDVFEDADARQVYEHIAVQVNVTGEAAGTFYIEIAERHVCVEPYDYYNHDACVRVDTKTLCDLMERRITYADACKDGNVWIEGNPYKIGLLGKVNVKIAKKHGQKER